MLQQIRAYFDPIVTKVTKFLQISDLPFCCASFWRKLENGWYHLYEDAGPSPPVYWKCFISVHWTHPPFRLVFSNFASFPLNILQLLLSSFFHLSATRLSVRLLRISPRIPRCFASKAFRRSVQPALPFLLPTVFIPAFRFSVFLESLAFLRRFSSAFGFSPAVLECRLLPVPHCLFEWSSQDFCLFSPAMSVLYTGRFCLSIGFLKIFENFSTNLPSSVFPRDSRSFFAFFGQK